jgi:hypothetical protein
MAVAGGQHVRNDDAIFSEYVTISCAAVQHDEDDEAHSSMTKTARDFLKKKFGTISRFYSGISSADTGDVNGFSRINTLRKALAALDRGGWERSYHQRIFHVSVVMSYCATHTQDGNCVSGRGLHTATHHSTGSRTS